MTRFIELANILNDKLKYNSLQCELITLLLLYDSILDDLLELSYSEAAQNPDENPDSITVLPTDFSLTLPTSMQVGRSIIVKPTFVPSNTTATGTICVSDDESVLKIKTIGDSYALTAVSVGEASFTITSTSVPELSYTYTIMIESATITANNIYYGVLPASLGITSFSAITDTQIVSHLRKIAAYTLPKTKVSVSAGDILIVVVGESKVATKDNGLGTKIQFASSARNPEDGKPILANGEVAMEINSYPYKLYGEFVITAGAQYIYVD